MNGGRFRVGLILLLILAIAGLALLATAEESEATIVGDPLPPWGGDWFIFQDTVATDEVIRLDGSIYVFWPSKLSLDGCTVIFNDTWNPSHGIYVDWGSVLWMNATSTNDPVVKGNATDDTWWFQSLGEVYISDATLTDLYWGIQNFGAYVSVEDSTIDAIEYGIYSFGDTHVGNSTIRVKSIDTTSSSYYMYGVYVHSGLASLHNLDIKMTLDQNVTYNSSYISWRRYTYGIYLYDANAVRLVPTTGKDFKIDISVDMAIHDYYDTSYVTMRMYLRTRPLYMTGDTVCKEIKDLQITTSESFHGAIYNATSSGNVYLYNEQDMIYSSISSGGMAPIEVSEMTFSNLGGTLTTGGGKVTNSQVYWSNDCLYFSDHADSRSKDTVTKLKDLTFEDSTIDQVIRLPMDPEIELTDCTFRNLDTNRLVSHSGATSDFSIRLNDFDDITYMSDGSDLFYIYNNAAEGIIANNTFTDVEAWTFLYLYDPDDRLYFEGNTMTDCTQPEGAWDGFFWFEDNNDKVTIGENTFDSGIFQQFMYVRDVHDKFVIEKNTFEDMTLSDYLLRTYYTRSEVEFIENDVMDNMGPLFEFDRNYDRISFERNKVEDNRVGADYLVYTWETRSELKFTDNDIKNNTADGILLYFKGVTYWTSSADFNFERNDLHDNVASSAFNGGVVVLKGVRYDLAIRRNEFDGNTGNCINFYHPYSRNSNYGYTFTVDGNEFKNNDGTCTLWVDFSGYHIVVKRNTGTNNAGPLIWHVMTAHYVDDTDDPDRTGEVIGPRSFTIDQNNYSYNRGGAVDLKAQWTDPFTPYTQGGQSISLKNNKFLGNGDGWAIRILDFGAFPQLFNNEFYGSDYGVFLKAIDYPARWPMVTMTFNNESYDGGMTAWGLVNVNAIFYDCTFTRFAEALYAKDCQIDVYWSAIPEASGRTEGRGYIYVYNHIEFLITWADDNGVDSMKPAVGATLALRGTNGRYYGAMVTNDLGRIGPLLIMPWSSVEGKMDAWSPYDATVMAGGLSARHVVHAIGELVGEDAVHLTIRDTGLPNIVINSPSDGETSNKVDLPVEGFLFETGSEVLTFMGYLDGSPEGQAIAPAEIWTTVFEGLSPGAHDLFFEVVDLAGNYANASVSFFIDDQAPTLDITNPEDGDVTSELTILIQGTFQDDVSPTSEIVIRINGEVYDVPTGSINEYIDLTEGVNTIEIDATDRAGNRMAELITVTLDATPPTLYVYTPLNRIVTSEETLTITGLSEADAEIQIDHLIGTTPVSEPVKLYPDADGTFEHTLTLEEGSQTIGVTATDPAGNVRILDPSRTVTLDTEPPKLFIDEPKAPEVHHPDPTISVMGHVDDPNLDDIRVFINGLEVEHNPYFSKEVPLMEGANTIVVRAVDLVGNFARKTLNVTRDTTKPELEIENPSFILTRNRLLTVRGTVNADAHVVTVNGEAVNVDEQLKFSKEVDLTSVTGDTIEVVARDMANNSAGYIIHFEYDATKPTLTLDELPTTVSRLVLYLNGSVSDNLEYPIMYVEVMGDMHPVVNGRFSVLVDLSTANEGWNNFTVRVHDDAGNVASEDVSVQYVEPKKEKEEDEGTSGETLSWLGLLLLIAAITLIATVAVFARRGVRE